MNIFELKNAEQINSRTPLQSHAFHRFAYIIYDKEEQSCKQIRILPYLHDRKIYLKSHKKNTTYIYSAIETTIKEEQDFIEKQKQLEDDESSVGSFRTSNKSIIQRLNTNKKEDN